MAPNTSTQMFEILDETEGDLVAIRVNRGPARVTANCTHCSPRRQTSMVLSVF